MSTNLRRAGLSGLAAVAAVFWNPGLSAAQPPAPAAAALHDGGHDFDFLIGDWKAHVRRLPDRLVGSNKWVEYDGISNHHKLLDSNANFEEFEVRNAAGDHLKGQTLRLYNAETRQWSIWLLDVNAGTLSGPPQIGDFTSTPDRKRGEFYAADLWKGRQVAIRYQWFNLTPKSARMEQAFSADGGRTWEVNWICELTR
ncbi:hypothetical protein [Phenylobacterium sp.]|uniref:hypothetical protein n=1 Tax=Phenylobacterium sp. TaxID=1871053 RepID=UPI002BB37F6E|nr:hypothetical protein [Phenylobacterium sp.]HLZ75568.1 hypothetical protein [Phenylobacterium sp.]